MPKSPIKATAADARVSAVDWQRWRTQAVRDLAWCCLGEDLMVQLPATCARPYNLPVSTTHLMDWLDQLDCDPFPLLDYLAALKSTRLGVYFEALWRFFWLWQSDTQILAYNRQVEYNHHTLGAFDFLLQQNRGDEKKFLHVECAVKFYLGTGGEQWHHWIGPGANDRLDIKLERLLQHQLPLSQHPAVATMEILPGVRAQTFRQTYLLRGYFFSHVSNPDERPVYSNPRLPSSLWCYSHELPEVIKKDDYHYALLLRQQWLSPAVTTTRQASVTAKDICDLVDQQRRAVFISAYTPANYDTVEQQRLCVVPDHWPATVTPPRNI